MLNAIAKLAPSRAHVAFWVLWVQLMVGAHLPLEAVTDGLKANQTHLDCFDRPFSHYLHKLSVACIAAYWITALVQKVRSIRPIIISQNTTSSATSKHI